MNKIYLSSAIFLLSIFCVFSQGSMTLGLGSGTHPFLEYRVDTLAHFKVGPGTYYTALKFTHLNFGSGTAQHQRVFFLTADLRNPYLELRQALSRDSLYGTEQPTRTARRKTSPGNFYFAGINGDFFDTFTGDPQRPAGRPIGGNMVNSQIAQIPNNFRNFAVDERGMPDIGLMSYTGTVTFGSSTRTINNVNHRRGENALVLYNSTYGRNTQTNEHGTEVQIELLAGEAWGVNRTVRARLTSNPVTGVGNMRIPAGQAVLSGHGTSAAWLRELSVGDEVEISLSMVMNGNNWAWSQMTGGDPREVMLFNGVPNTSDIWNERHPRTGIGFTQCRDTIIMTVVDGRQAPVSTGVTTLHLAQIMQKQARAWSALNLDGGGSSTLFAEPFGQLNVGSDGIERASGNSVLLVATSPPDNQVGAIASHTPVLNLPIFGEFVPKFLSYNQFGVLINTDFKGATLSAPETLGTVVNGNKFVAGPNITSGIITATYNGAVTEIRVNLVPIDAVEPRLTSVLVDNRDNWAIEVMAMTDLGIMPVSPVALSWNVDNPEILKVIDGQIHALQNGTTTIRGTLNNSTRTGTDTADIEIEITVEIPTAPIMRSAGTELANWTMSVPTQYRPTAQLNTENLPANWDTGIAVNFTHAAGLGPAVNLTNSIPLYGLPDELRIVINAGDIAFANTNAVRISLRANNARQAVSFNLHSVGANQDYTLVVPLANVFDVSDRAVFPVLFEGINFSFRTGTGGMVNGRNYTLAIKELQLVFERVQTNIPIVDGRPAFMVFPNPAAHGMLHLQLSENTGQSVRTEIFNMQGQLLSSQTHGNFSGTPISLSIQDLPAGTYLLRVFENEQVGTMQFIVK